jgi:hypothetical protein
LFERAKMNADESSFAGSSHYARCSGAALQIARSDSDAPIKGIAASLSHPAP